MFFAWVKRVLFGIIILIIGVVFYLVIPIKITPAEQITWGATFTKSYAQYLGLDWKPAYLATLDDLGIKSVRIGISWDEIEPRQGQFEFSDYDFMIDEAEKRGITVLPAIGFKLPRWPECRAPAWVQEWLPKNSAFWKRWLDVGVGPHRQEFEAAQMTMMKTVVEHFKTRTAIKSWQVENEGFIGWFGDCPPIKDSFIRQEAAFVRSLDARPIVMTESGELSSGLKSALVSDAVGTSLYREVWSPLLGRFLTYPLPPSFYARKANLLKPWVSRFFISELQLEAWAPQGILNMPIEDQLKQLTPEIMKQRIAYARKTGADEIYGWGAEWWWYLKMHGYPQLWEVAREEFGR